MYKSFLANNWVVLPICFAYSWFKSGMVFAEFFISHVVQAALMGYCSYYFYNRSRGDNYIFVAPAYRASSRGVLIVSDFIAAATYLFWVNFFCSS